MILKKKKWKIEICAILSITRDQMLAKRNDRIANNIAVQK